MEDKIIITTALRKLLAMSQRNKRIKIVPGGSSAGKTIAILMVLIDQCAKTPMLEVSVVGESLPHLKKGAMRDFIKIMRMTSRFDPSRMNYTSMTYTFANGAYMEFFSADDEKRVRGPRRHVLYVNEANLLPFETFHQLLMRTRLSAWIDFNPSEEFWAHTEYSDDDTVEWMTLTYEDNESLSEDEVNEFLKAKRKAYHDPTLPLPYLLDAKNVKTEWWHNWWKVYGLGMTGALEGVVFDNWSVIRGVPDGARLLGFGLDFGFTNDPTALVALYSLNGHPLYHLLLYEKGLRNATIAEKMIKARMIRQDMIVADSAEPKSIAELNHILGFNIKPAVKGPDSVRYGIDLMQQTEFYVTEASVDLIRELRRYSWERGNTGKPVDRDNHAIDAARYISMRCLSKLRVRKKIRRRN